MDLEELQKKIYRPGSQFEERPKTPETFQVGRKQEKRVTTEWQEEKKKEPMSPKKKNKLIIWGSVVGVLFFTIAGLLIWRGLTSFDKSKIAITITGAEKASSGEEIIYKIEYKNNTRLDLSNVRLVFYYPENSIPSNGGKTIQSFDLPNLRAGQEESIKLSTKIFGVINDKQEAKLELSYQPGTISSQFVSKTNFTTEISSIPLTLSFDLPEKIVSGQFFEFSLDYLNQANTSFDNMQIQIDYPSGFILESSIPEPIKEDNVWSVGYLMGQQQGKIILSGSIDGRTGDVRNFKATIGELEEDKFVTYTEINQALEISSSPLFLSQTVNGGIDSVVQAGQRLDYVINYKNTADVGIRNVFITVKLQGEALNMPSIQLDKGSFNGATNEITWKPSNLPDLSYLAPNQEGQASFSIKVKDNLPVNDLTDKNFVIVSEAVIDAPQKPTSLQDIEIIGTSKIETKIISQLLLKSMGYYYDNIFANSGPVPPHVGQTTTYTIKWQLVNVGNDLKNVEVSATLPPHIEWQNKTSPSGENIVYNADSGKLIWRIDSLPASTGVLLPAKQVSFQIAIIPGVAHVGSLMELIGQSIVRGQDDFVNLELADAQEAIDTDLPDDSQISHSEGVIVE
ncbi:MAG: hypothetical protein ABH887_01585 [bacterium]